MAQNFGRSPFGHFSKLSILSVPKPCTYFCVCITDGKARIFFSTYFPNFYAAACFEPTSVGEFHRDQGPFEGRLLY